METKIPTEKKTETARKLERIEKKRQTEPDRGDRERGSACETRTCCG